MLNKQASYWSRKHESGARDMGSEIIATIAGRENPTRRAKRQLM